LAWWIGGQQKEWTFPKARGSPPEKSMTPSKMKMKMIERADVTTSRAYFTWSEHVEKADVMTTLTFKFQVHCTLDN
jgi:hypothetical protein